jgi:hypothetical protein
MRLKRRLEALEVASPPDGPRLLVNHSEDGPLRWRDALTGRTLTSGELGSLADQRRSIKVYAGFATWEA